MAHANNSIITGSLKGSLGKELVFRQWDGKTVVSKKPEKRNRDSTAAQLVAQEKFIFASRYARSILTRADKSFAEAYAGALKPRQNVYSRALEDFLSQLVLCLVRRLAGCE